MYRGARQAFTLRLPVTLARQVIVAARQRRWSVNDMLAWCVEETLMREGASRVG
jgi:hypothetical protein